MMLEVKEQCKGCYHFQVCANILKQQLFIREKLGEENPSCEQFISTADVVEVVRCKDCKHCEQSPLYKEKGKESKLEYICCAFGNVNPDFYCGIGERREE